MKSPVVSVRLGETEHSVTFNLGRLIAIESALEIGLIDLARQLSGYMPAMKEGAVDPASVEAVTVASRVGFMARFVAAALGMTTDRLGEQVAVSGLWELFYRLALGFMSAVMDLQGVEPGGEPEGAAGKTAAAQEAGTADDSGPGPGSSSASGEPSSTGCLPLAWPT